MSRNKEYTREEREHLSGTLKRFWEQHPELKKKLSLVAKPFYKFFIEHHLNGNKKDNREENKIVVTQFFHKRLHNKAYNYLVKIGKHEEYVEWAFNNLEEFYNKEVWE